MNKTNSTLFFLLLVLIVSGAGADTAATGPFYSILDYGARGDGATMNTQAIQSAIDAAAKAGGGTVFVSAGRFLTGTVVMKDCVTLFLDAGSVLLGSRDPKDYPEHWPAFRSYTDNYVCQSLIAGENLHHVSILGRGTIDGQGAAFKWKEYKNRPYLIRLVSCTDISIEGITLTNSAMWMQQYLNCERVAVRAITVDNHVTYNNDGIDIDCCREVMISDCRLDSDDDALCLKSTSDTPTRDVTITNCVLSSHCNAFKMGTESNGGFQNITVSNCAILSPPRSQSTYGMGRGLAGLALEIVDGGTLDGVTISNISMQGITTPIFMRLGNRARPFKKDMDKPGMGTFQNVSLNNITATHASPVGCSITGMPGYPIRNVSLSDINITFDGGGTGEDAAKAIPENETKYPESTMFGTLPSYGFYCRHVDGLTFDNVKLQYSEPEWRPALVCDDVRNLKLFGLEAQSMAGDTAAIVFDSVQRASIRNCSAWPGSGTFLRMCGKTEAIRVIANDLSGAETAFAFDGVPALVLFETANLIGSK